MSYIFDHICLPRNRQMQELLQRDVGQSIPYDVVAANGPWTSQARYNTMSCNGHDTLERQAPVTMGVSHHGYNRSRHDQNSFTISCTRCVNNRRMATGRPPRASTFIRGSLLSEAALVESSTCRDRMRTEMCNRPQPPPSKRCLPTSYCCNTPDPIVATISTASLRT